MTIKEAYRKILVQAQTIYTSNEAMVITDLIFENLVNIQRADIIKTPEKELSKHSLNELDKCLHQLLLHKPIQYILGYAWFYKMRLKVNEYVLIPRPETEELVELIIKDAKEKNSNLKILDIGTGTGCISIALKKYLSTADITAIDISEMAILVAKENAAEQNTAIQFIHFNFLDEGCWCNLPTFDTIVSNPPYIPTNEIEKLNQNVKAYEPHSALFVPNDRPVLFYEKIAKFGKKFLRANGKIFVEIHEDFAEKNAKVFIDAGYKNVIVKRDIFEKERIIIAF